MEVDELFAVRNHFWLGNFSEALLEAEKVRPGNDREEIDKQVYTLRAKMALGDAGSVVASVGDQTSAPTDVLAVKLLASYVTAAPAQKDAILDTMKEWLADETLKDNAMLKAMAGSAFFLHGDTKEALRALGTGGSLEMHAMRVQIYLSMNRADAASRELQAMQKIDDDSTLTQLALAWVDLASGGEKYQEAAYIYQEQMDKTMQSPLMLNGIGVANLHLKQFSEAEKFLEDAHSSDSKNPDVIINLMSCYANLRKPAEKIEELLKELDGIAPSHPLLAQMKACDETFEQVATSHQVPS